MADRRAAVLPGATAAVGLQMAASLAFVGLLLGLTAFTAVATAQSTKRTPGPHPTVPPIGASAIPDAPSYEPPVPPPQVRSASGPSKRIVHYRQKPRHVRRFWTPRRIGLARSNPRPVPVERHEAGSEVHDPSNKSPNYDKRHDPRINYPIYNVTSAGYLSGNGYDKRIGRLYYSVQGDPNRVGSCSATLVARNLLITAAHCVSGLENFVWDSGQIGNQAPGGVWSAPINGADYFLAYDQGWNGQRPGYPVDYAVLTLKRNSAGYYPGDYWGWFPIQTSFAATNVLQEGYPAEGIFEPNCPTPSSASYPSCYVFMNWSPIATWYAYSSGWYEYVIGGYTNGGASGGPMLQNTGGQWYVRGVVSHGDNNIWACPSTSFCAGRRYLGRNIWSPYFNSYVTYLWGLHAMT